MTEEDRQTCTRDACPFSGAIIGQGERLSTLTESAEKAHTRLLEHEVRLSRVEVQHDHFTGRVERAEESIATTANALSELKAKVDGMTVILTNVSVTAHSTYEMLREHISSNSASLEKQTRQFTQTAGLIGAVVLLLSMIHSAVSGQSLPHLFTSVLAWIGL
jgi:chromosome segregation ATPase